MQSAFFYLIYILNNTFVNCTSESQTTGKWNLQRLSNKLKIDENNQLVECDFFHFSIFILGGTTWKQDKNITWGTIKTKQKKKEKKTVVELTISQRPYLRAISKNFNQG